ncbi:MAG: hypothetical protein Q3974_08695, partial [Rothia sp. (in: high G+C Gram-positive bacteria)]|nr:hypothetical protein [Rothia sp. (in: high G+C Gram-positive bacteria)]
MTTAEHFTESPSFESPVRNAADIIAFAVHNLGYWPHDSIVLVTASEHRMGPTVRANAGNLGVQEAADLLIELLQMMPSELDAAERIEKFFIIQFGQGGDLRNRQLNPATVC